MEQDRQTKKRGATIMKTTLTKRPRIKKSGSVPLNKEGIHDDASQLMTEANRRRDMEVLLRKKPAQRKRA